MARFRTVFLEVVRAPYLTVVRSVVMCLVLLLGNVNMHTEAANGQPGLRTAGSLVTVANAPECFLRIKYVRSGKWRTLESFWNAKGTAFFRAPKGAKIKVRYGKFFGKDRQKNTLDGTTYKKLAVGSWSLTYARMQIQVAKDTQVTYVICPGGVALKSPTIRF